jgi:hypothetical protein
MMGHLRLQKKECGKPGAKLTKTNRGNDGGAEQHHAHGAAAMADSYGDDSGSAVARSSSSVPAQGRGEGRTGSAIRKGKQTAVRQQLTKEVATVGEGGTAAQLGARPALNVTREVAWRRRQPLERERGRGWRAALDGLPSRRVIGAGGRHGDRAMAATVVVWRSATV